MAWTDHSINFTKEANMAAEEAVKRKVKRQSFMGEKCPECSREFKVEKDYTEYRMTCPYCGKAHKSVRILVDNANRGK